MTEIKKKAEKDADEFMDKFFRKNPFFQDVFCLNCFAPNCRYNHSCIKCNYPFIHYGE